MVLSIMTLCNLVGTYKHFRRTYSLRLQAKNEQCWKLAGYTEVQGKQTNQLYNLTSMRPIKKVCSTHNVFTL
jgi:hypothetical protein